MELALRRNRGREECEGVARAVADFLGRPYATLRWLPLDEVDRLAQQFADRSPFVVDDPRDLVMDDAWRELWTDDRETTVARFTRAVQALPRGGLFLLSDGADICGAVAVTRDELLADPGRFVVTGEGDVQLVTADGAAGVHVNGDTDSGHAEQKWGVAGWTAES